MRLFVVCLVLPLLTNAQQLLHYTETSGFDHGTRAVSLSMFEAIGVLDGYLVVDDQDGSEFDSLTGLLQYDAILFSNTSGDAILDSAQRSHFESYIAAGGNLMGIHAASDTYRHSTANGGSTGTWDFYAETVGGSVQQTPNHVAGTPSYMMSHVGMHQSTMNIPDPWTKNEEYYYWLNGYYDSTNVEVLEVEQTTGPNGMVNDYDSTRAMSWYRELSTGSRVFYTALGHAQSNFTSDTLFRQHIRDALEWLTDGTTTILPEQHRNEWLNVRTENGVLLADWSSAAPAQTRITLISVSGRTWTWQTRDSSFRKQLDLSNGIYVLLVEWEDNRVTSTFIWLD
jgi:type 1 glutamine amidotransferase